MRIITFFMLLVMFLPGCAFLQPNNDEMKKKIEELKLENNKLQHQNQNLHADNEKLASAGGKILARLNQTQTQNHILSKENRDLVAQNQELFTKLYAERLRKQKYQADNLSESSDDLELEAKKLFQSYQKPIMQKSSKVRIPIKSASEATPAHSFVTPSIIATELSKKRLQLIEKNLWTIADERKFVNITDSLNQTTAPKDKQKMIEKAQQFNTQLAQRLLSNQS